MVSCFLLLNKGAANRKQVRFVKEHHGKEALRVCKLHVTQTDGKGHANFLFTGQGITFTDGIFHQICRLPDI